MISTTESIIAFGAFVWIKKTVHMQPKRKLFRKTQRLITVNLPHG